VQQRIACCVMGDGKTIATSQGFGRFESFSFHKSFMVNLNLHKRLFVFQVVQDYDILILGIFYHDMYYN